MNRKILQLLPATGYRAVYTIEPGGNDPDFDVPVACFALVEEATDNEIGTRIVPMIVTDCFDDAESDNFLGCVGPGFSKGAVNQIVVEYGKDGCGVFKIVKFCQAEQPNQGASEPNPK